MKPRDIIRENFTFIGLLIFVCVIVYLNALNGEFSVVDDLSGFVKNEQIRNLSGSLKTFQIETVAYSLSYHLFGISPFPLHLNSLILHIGVTILAFISISMLFGKEISLISSLLFAVHPVNTEAVSWISGVPYLYRTLFAYLIIIPYLIYKQNKNNLYFIIAMTIFSLALILTKSPWILVIPMALVVIDQFFLEKKISIKSFLKLSLFVIPVAIFYLISLQESYTMRVSYRRDGTHTVMNQQALTPMLESYPYTIYSLLKLYIFPKNLTIYYDGNIITDTTYISMFVTTALFILSIAYFWKKNRKVAGLFIILPVLIAPTFSPVKVTWFIAERYLYLGAGFFCVLMAMLILKLEDKTKMKYLSVVLTVSLLVIYSIRTISRNNDWSSPKSLALATIKTSPYSVRSYNDLGGAYAMKGDFETAIKYYEKALEVNPSNTAMRNLGYIYLQNGFPEFTVGKDEETAEIDPNLYQTLFNQGVSEFQNGQHRIALYYLSKALEVNPSFVDAIGVVGAIYLKENKLDFASKQFKNFLKIDPRRDMPFYMLGSIEYKKGNFQAAREYLIKTLEINPDHAEAQQNLKMLEKMK